MKKILYILCVFLFSVSVLCACGEDKVPSSVQEWFELNEETIAEYCETASSDTHTITVKAQDNTFIFSVMFTDLTAEELTEAQQGAVNDQQKWNDKTDEEKQEYLETYVKTLEANGFEGMPVPECLVTQLLNENGDIIASTYFGK